MASTVRLIAEAMVRDSRTQDPQEVVVNQVWTSFHEELTTPSQVA